MRISLLTHVGIIFILNLFLKNNFYNMASTTTKTVVSIVIGVLIGLSPLRNSGLTKVIITVTGG